MQIGKLIAYNRVSKIRKKYYEDLHLMYLLIKWHEIYVILLSGPCTKVFLHFNVKILSCVCAVHSTIVIPGLNLDVRMVFYFWKV